MGRERQPACSCNSLSKDVLAADQNHLDPKSLRRLNCAFHFRLGKVIASHGVEGNGHHVIGFSFAPIGLHSSVSQRLFRNLDHFAALVFAAMRAGAVGAYLLVAVRAFGAVAGLAERHAPGGWRSGALNGGVLDLA